MAPRWEASGGASARPGSAANCLSSLKSLIFNFEVISDFSQHYKISTQWKSDLRTFDFRSNVLEFFKM